MYAEEGSAKYAARTTIMAATTTSGATPPDPAHAHHPHTAHSTPHKNAPARFDWADLNVVQWKYEIFFTLHK